MRYFLIYFFVFFSLMFSKNAFSEDQKLSDYLTEQLGEYFKKYEVERKEKFIAKEKITELEEELEDEKKALEKSNKKLKNISPIEINRSSAIFVLSSLLLLVIIILFLSLIIIRQRKWRREYYDENNSKFIGQLPERIAETIDRSEEAYNNLEKKNRKQYDNFQQNLLQVAKLLEQVSNKNQENASRINEQLSAIRRYGDEKDVLLKKYQKFYDLGTFKNFIFEIIASIDSLENSIQKLTEEKKSQSSIEAIERAKDRLIILLENENIAVVTPDKQLKFNDGKQPIKCKAIDSIETEDDSLIGMISSIVHSGYDGRIGENETALIREAWVNVYVNTNKEDNNNG